MTVSEMAGPADHSDSGSGSALQNVFEKLRSTHTLSLTLTSPLCLAVVALDRYLSLQHPSGESYSYDLTITDGRWRMKCQLADSLTRWVRRGSLRCGTGVLVSLLSLVHDETRLSHSYLRIDGIHSVVELPERFLSIKDVEKVPQWCQDYVTRSDGPLQLSRKYYLPLWINDDPYGSVWIPNNPPPDVAIDVSRITLVADLDVFFHSSRRPLPLLVRILHRSRIRYYGKPGQNIDFPFQVYCEVADQSGVMSMVVWNDLCLEWFNRLTVGSVLYLQQYSLKHSYQKRSRPQIHTLSLMAFHSIEICLNPRSPASVVTVIPPKSVQPQWGLPDVPYNFATRSEVDSMNNNQACDVIGLVTYVGRVELIRSKEKTGPEKFWAYRWVHAVDGTTDSPFILEIFSTSQPEIFNNICPMTYLVCTQMRVCRTGCSVYLTSSTETQLFITGCHKKQPYVNEPKVKAFIQWTKTLKDSVMLRRTAVGGHYRYPPAPPTFTPTTTNSNMTDEFSITAVAELKGELESLQYREHRRVAVQGHVAAVQFHIWPPPQHEPPHSNRQQEGVSERGVSNTVPAIHSSTKDEMTLSQRETDTTSPDSDITVAPKRRRVQTGSRYNAGMQVAFTSREEEEQQQQQPDEGELESDESEETDQTSQVPDVQQAASHPIALWESRVWPLVKQQVTDHICSGRLDQESIPEKFHFDDREVLLHDLNLSAARWNPDLTSQTHTHTPVACPGYFMLTILGLNQTAAVDVLFVPVVSSDDPRAAGVPDTQHDNSLLSCISSGRLCVQPDGSFPAPVSLMSSAPMLESERVVCIVDLCLLGEGRVEMMCSKLYRTADICQPNNTQ
ncbi:RPA-related protein RADX isoform X4 [Pimephales promelas]|uniref:RPA-related protein RADX isoform X4 n=1 Tax=Pimephales promelas TaxID=90988 RepID=UPI001955909A|nr:RPA-related protein RADX isoform X4 [Pimephales promelas]KAG1958290.1 RPA-related protein RADX [Pimephales promelas]